MDYNFSSIVPYDFESGSARLSLKQRYCCLNWCEKGRKVTREKENGDCFLVAQVFSSFYSSRDRLKMFSPQESDLKTTQLKAEVLLSKPSSHEDLEHEERIERATCSYSNESERFFLSERNFSRQYAQIYSVRIMAMRKKLAAAARRKWGM